MSSPSSSSKEDPVTVQELEDAGRRLISLPSSVVEQLHLLDVVENVLKKVEQSSLQPVIDALIPITEALVADRLLKNDVRDVKNSVASCISQIMRITAPDSPYGDEELKIYFHVSVSAFETLSSLSDPQFTKAISILETFAKFRTCVLMLDLELDAEIVKMFRHFFGSVGSNLPPNVSCYVERTMTLVIEESEELPEEIIMLLLDHLKMENQKAQPLAWELGENILKNCGTTLKTYIPKAVALMGVDLDDFAPIVASICRDASGNQNLEVKEAEPEAIEHEKASGLTSVAKNNTAVNGNASKAKKPSKSTKPFTRSKQQRNSKSKENEDGQPIAVAKGNNSESKKSGKGESSTKTSKEKNQSEIIDTTAKETKTELNTTEVIPNKRNRKPNSLLKPDEGYWTPQLKRNSKKKLDSVNVSEGDEKVSNSTSKTNRNKEGGLQHGEASKVEQKGLSTELKEEVTNSTSKTKRIKEGSRQQGEASTVKRKGLSTELKEEVTNSISKTKRKKEGRRQQGEASKVKRKSLSTKLKEEATKKTRAVKIRGEKLVGRKIQVWWPEDSIFYPGKITSFERASNKYQVLYNDGEVEALDMKKERWELVKDGEEVTSGSEAPNDVVIPESKKIKADMVEVEGYKVKASIARTLEDIFSKYGDIASKCPYKSAMLKASLLEIVCDTVQRLHNNDCVPDFNVVESVINDAEKAKLNVEWLRVELEKRRVAKESGQTGAMLRETKRRILHAVKAAKFELEHRKAELAKAQKRLEEAERRFQALQCVKRKVEDDILENEAATVALSKKRSKLV